MIDLRSDTVTQPTAEMLEAMRSARLGDDSRDGDPTVGEFEAFAAARTGKEAAIFVPSGTMGNLVALMAHTGRGGEVLLEEGSHILKSEMGAIAGVAGLFHRTIRGARGAMDLGALTEAVNATMKPNKLATALIEMETTHNGAGGTDINTISTFSNRAGTGAAFARMALGYQDRAPDQTASARGGRGNVQEAIKGIAANAQTARLYVSTSRRVAAYDLEIRGTVEK